MPVSLSMAFSKPSKNTVGGAAAAARTVTAAAVAMPSTSRAGFRGNMFQNIQGAKKCGSCGGFKH